MLKFNELNLDTEVFSGKFDKFLRNKNISSKDVSETVANIISKVRNEGDIALHDFVKKLDGYEGKDFLVRKEEIDTAFRSLDKSLLNSLEYSFEMMLKYQTHCFNSLNLESNDNEITRKFRILDSVGMYIPGGQASYPSTVLMGAAPAIACGVKNISICTPATNGTLSSLSLAAAKIAGVDNIYKIGGAQAIAALALGTEQVSKVEKIIGPGNIYVAEAKKQLFGEVGIDSIAGPSEIVILADDTSDPEMVAWDLMAQSEHDIDASVILICTSKNIIEAVKEVIEKEVKFLERSHIIVNSLNSNGLMIKIDELSQALEIINKLAPEHLHLAYDHENSFDEDKLVAGLILKGKYSANSLSDYVLGPSHILPTNSSARFSSPLSVEDFLVSYSYISLKNGPQQKNYKELILHTSKIANAEGLTAHAKSAEIRLKD